MGARTWILAPAVLLILAFALYGSGLGYAFHLDDTTSIVENRAVRQGDLVEAVRFWPGRSLVYLTFALQHRVSGSSSTAFRAVNVASHALAASALFWLLYGLLRVSVPGRDPRFAAGLAALCFLVHPLQTQSVVYIVQRATLWAALFSLLALAAQVHSWRRSELAGRWRTLAYLSAVAALFSKEWAIVLPLAMLLAEGLFPAEKRWRLQLPASLLLLLVVPVTAAVGGSFGDAGSSSLVAETESVTRWSYFLTQAEVLNRYLRLIVWPLGQSVDHHVQWRDEFLSTLPWFLPLSIIGSVGLVAWRRKHPVTAFAILSSALFALPESSLFPILDPMFEHRMYMPMAGVCMLVGLAGGWLARRRLGLAFGLCIALLSVLSWRSVARIAVWESSETLWRDAVATSPEKSRPRVGLGLALAQRGELMAARAELELAVRLRPSSARAWTNLGNIQLMQGELAAAVATLRRATELKSDHAPAWYNLGVAYDRRSEWGQALIAFRRASELRPDHAGAWNSLAAVQLRLGDRDGAASSARRAAELGSPAPQLLRATGQAP